MLDIHSRFASSIFWRIAVSTVLVATAAAAPPRVPNQTPVEALLDAHGWGTVVRDDALNSAAALVAERLAGPPDGPAPRDVIDHLRFAMHARRLSDARVYPLTVRHRRSEELLDPLPALLARLDRRAPPTHYGLATHGRPDGLTTTLLLVHRGVTLSSPLPLRGELGGQVRVHGALRRGYFRPRVVVAPPGSRPVRDRPAWSGQRAVDVTVFFDAGPGPYGLEIIADSQYGPTVLNNYIVYVGVEPPPLPVTRLAPPSQGVDEVSLLLKLINRERARAGVAGLVWHPDLAIAARDYAAELAQRGTLSHASPDSGTLRTRLRSRAVRFRRVAENLAEAATPHKAMEALMRSPAHKGSLLDAGLTHVGIGVTGRYHVVALAAP